MGNFLDPRLPDRFWSKCSPCPVSGCWLWFGATTTGGYSHYWHDELTQPAHRVAYEILIEAIPEGLVIDHLCRVRCCVNPAHLEIVTGRENTLRGVSGSAVNARKVKCACGAEYITRFLRNRRPDRECKACRRSYQYGLVAEGFCRFGRSHGPHRPGSTLCERCHEKRAERYQRPKLEQLRMEMERDSVRLAERASEIEAMEKRR